MKTLLGWKFAATLCAVTVCSPCVHAFVTNGTKWGMGPNVAEQLSGNEGSPGAFTWSIMEPGLGFQGYESHAGALTSEFGLLLGGSTRTEEIAAIEWALGEWASVSGLTLMGPVADGGVNGGAPESMGGHLGDMRFGAVGEGYGGAVLGHAYQPGNESIYGTGGSITGDIHMNTQYTFVDDPNQVWQGGDPFDFKTVMLHEIGHSLGLGHSDVPGSIMRSEYIGTKRDLRADDIAGIQYIYGPVPEPATFAALGLGLLALCRRRKVA